MSRIFDTQKTALLLCTRHGLTQAAPKPNLIVILADDLIFALVAGSSGSLLCLEAMPWRPCDAMTKFSQFKTDLRRWIIENDWLEAIVALPEQMFYNTGIGTFIWIVNNRKSKQRKAKIQLIDSRDRWKPMKRSLGDKRRYLDDDTIDTRTREHGGFEQSATSKLFDNADFGYRRITVEHPLRLRFQITDEAKETFLNACHELLDAVEAVEEELGTEPYLDWNTTWVDVQRIVKDCDIGWDSGANATRQKKLFRDCFTETDPKAEPVIAKRGSYAGIVGAGDFPGQKLAGDLETRALDRVFGVFPETKGKKGKAVQYEADPRLRDNENNWRIIHRLHEIGRFLLLDPDHQLRHARTE